jgi:bifunctional pyridoxal-dependent enzyme with beta-cystathionase and maltose regulon repressor activities
MIYKFDEIINRHGYNCAKYDQSLQKFGKENVIPLWIADMDFKTSKQVIGSMVSRAEHGIFGYVSKSTSYKMIYKRRDYGIGIEDNFVINPLEAENHGLAHG